MEPDELWRKIAPKVPQKSFLRTLIDSVTVLGAEGRNFLVGYPLDQKSTIETLATAANKKQLETLLKESSGRDWTVKFLGKEGLVAKPASIQREMKSDLFKNDPLIQEALDIFKGEIKSVTT